MDWLVVSGNRCQYHGTGTINGTGNYSFVLTCIDGKINGGDGVDHFRIKIMDTTGGAVYDNQINTTDDAGLTSERDSAWRRQHHDPHQVARAAEPEPARPKGPRRTFRGPFSVTNLRKGGNLT